MAGKTDSWFPLYIADYLADTMHLSTRQHGAYLLLLMHAWRNGGLIPADNSAIAAIAKLASREWQQDKAAVLAFFHATDDGKALANKRASAELEKANDVSNKRSNSGAKGAAKRWQKPWQTPSQNDAPSPSPSQDSEPTTETEAAKGSAGAPPTAADVGLAIEAWNEAAERVGWPKVQAITDARRRAVKARLAECGGLDGWQSAMAKAEASAFLTGRVKPSNGHENWRCDFDFITRQAKFTKLMEGGFDDRPSSTDRKQSNLGANLEALAEWGRESTG